MVWRFIILLQEVDQGSAGRVWFVPLFVEIEEG